MSKKENTENSREFPQDYTPFTELKVCNNRFIEGNAIVSVKNYAPLLVGQGVVPMIWLSIPVSQDRKDWRYIIERNIASNPELKVTISKEMRSVQISVKETTLISAKKLSDDVAEIDVIDLRPIGLKIHGDQNGLFIGLNYLSQNTFEGSQNMISIDD